METCHRSVETCPELWHTSAALVGHIRSHFGTVIQQVRAVAAEVTLAVKELQQTIDCLLTKGEQHLLLLG